MPIRGSLDRCDDELIEGWVMLIDLPEKKLLLEAVLGDQIIGQFVADQFRADLQAAGLGDGACAFSFAMPAFVPRSEIRNLTIRLQGAPLYLKLPAAGGEAVALTTMRETVSRFGGLWIDRHDWLENLAARHRRGEISDALSSRIFRFVRDGYLVIEGAVPARTVTRVKKDIERLWQTPPEGLLIETFEPDGEMRYIKPDIRYRRLCIFPRRAGSNRRSGSCRIPHGNFCRQAASVPRPAFLERITAGDAQGHGLCKG